MGIRTFCQDGSFEGHLPGEAVFTSTQSNCSKAACPTLTQLAPRRFTYDKETHTCRTEFTSRTEPLRPRRSHILCMEKLQGVLASAQRQTAALLRAMLSLQDVTSPVIATPPVTLGTPLTSLTRVLRTAG